jgi:hypothetical protein
VLLWDIGFNGETNHHSFGKLMMLEMVLGIANPGVLANGTG